MEFVKDSRWIHYEVQPKIIADTGFCTRAESPHLQNSGYCSVDFFYGVFELKICPYFEDNSH